MADRTSIAWTEATWNPVTGCTKVSEGCDNCYAETVAHRFAGTAAYPHGFDLTQRPERLDQPLRWRRPRLVFVYSMSDLFHARIPDSYIDEVFTVMEQATRHTFQILTKRPGRMRSYLTRRAEHHPLPGHVWFGVSTESHHWATIRIPPLLEVPTPNRFLSCKPLLGPIDLTAIPGASTGVNWVIVGGESGHHARPMHAGWVDALRDQCTTAQIPFFFKQAGVQLAREWGCSGKGDDPAQWPVAYPQQMPIDQKGKP